MVVILLIIGIAFLYLLQRRQKQSRKVAPSAMFINSQRHGTTTPGPHSPVDGVPELEREKSIFGGMSGSGVSLGSKYRSRDTFWVEPWTPEGSSAPGSEPARRRDSSVIIKPWTPSGQSEQVSLSPLTTLETPSSTPAPSTSYYNPSSLPTQPPPSSFEKKVSQKRPPSEEIPPYVPRSQSVMSHQTAAPSYATHDELRQLPSPSPVPPHNSIPRRYSDGRSASEALTIISSNAPSLQNRGPINPVQPPTLMGNMAAFTTSPTSTLLPGSIGLMSPTGSSAYSDSPLIPVGRIATTTTPSRIRPLPVPGSQSTLSVTSIASSARTSGTGVRPLPRPPQRSRSQELEG